MTTQLTNEKLGLTLKPNIKHSGWWTLYNKDGKPLTSSTSYVQVKAHFDAIIRDCKAKELLDLQCYAEDVR